jgi:hypothetical protein
MKLTYEQQAQRIATLEQKLYHMTNKEARQAATVAELESKVLELEQQSVNLAFDSGNYKALLGRVDDWEAKYKEILGWALDIYVAYRDGYGWIESETDPLVMRRPDIVKEFDAKEGRVRQ